MDSESVQVCFVWCGWSDSFSGWQTARLDRRAAARHGDYDKVVCFPRRELGTTPSLWMHGYIHGDGLHTTIQKNELVTLPV